jgi:hypothetical protein
LNTLNKKTGNIVQLKYFLIIVYEWSTFSFKLHYWNYYLNYSWLICISTIKSIIFASIYIWLQYWDKLGIKSLFIYILHTSNFNNIFCYINISYVQNQIYKSCYQMCTNNVLIKKMSYSHLLQSYTSPMVSPSYKHTT